MVLTSNKRILEDRFSHQPAKCYKSLESFLEHFDGYPKMDLKNDSDSHKTSIGHAQVEDEPYSLAGESLNFSGVTCLSKSIGVNDAASLVRKDTVNGEIINDTTNEGIDSKAGTKGVSAVFQNGCSVKISTSIDKDNPRNSVSEDMDLNLSSFKSQGNMNSCSKSMREQTSDTLLASGSSGDSVSFGDGSANQHEIVKSGHHSKEIEACTSSSVGNVRKVSNASLSKSLSVHSSTLESSEKDCDSSYNLSYDTQSVGYFVSSSRDIVYSDEHYSSAARLTCFLVEPRRSVPIGPDFQAEIPAYRPSPKLLPSDVHDMSFQHDQILRSEDKEQDRLMPVQKTIEVANTDRVGQGRPAICNCPDPYSIRCVKEHIQAERQQLKAELGDTFYFWGFDEMGDTVSQKWTREEEQAFAEIVSVHPPSSNRNFWDYLVMAFPSKSKMELVSYYFNVFMLRRRALQNRFEPYDIDSDDDETNWHLSNRPAVPEDDDSSLSETDASEGEYENDESDENDDDMDEEDDLVTDSPVLSAEGTGVTEYDKESLNHERRTLDNQDCSHPVFDKGYHNSEQSNHVAVHKDSKHSPILFNHDNAKLSSQGACTADQYSVFGEAKTKGTTCSNKSNKIGKNLETVGEDITHKGLPRRDDFCIDGPYSLLESCDSKLWDMALSSSIKLDNDRLVSTCSMIKELFGDEGKANGS